MKNFFYKFLIIVSFVLAILLVIGKSPVWAKEPFSKEVMVFLQKNHYEYLERPVDNKKLLLIKVIGTNYNEFYKKVATGLANNVTRADREDLAAYHYFYLSEMKDRELICNHSKTQNTELFFWRNDESFVIHTSKGKTREEKNIFTGEPTPYRVEGSKIDAYQNKYIVFVLNQTSSIGATPIAEILKNNYSAATIEVGGVTYLNIKCNYEYLPGAAYSYLEHALSRYATPVSEPKIHEVYKTHFKKLGGLEFWFPNSSEGDKPFLWKIVKTKKPNAEVEGDWVDKKYTCNTATRFLFKLRL